MKDSQIAVFVVGCCLLIGQGCSNRVPDRPQVTVAVLEGAHLRVDGERMEPKALKERISRLRAEKGSTPIVKVLCPAGREFEALERVQTAITSAGCWYYELVMGSTKQTLRVFTSFGCGPPTTDVYVDLVRSNVWSDGELTMLRFPALLDEKPIRPYRITLLADSSKTVGEAADAMIECRKHGMDGFFIRSREEALQQGVIKDNQ